MPTTLTQPDTPHPDRGTHALRADLTPDGQGSVLTATLNPSTPEPLHLRVELGPRSLIGGPFTLAGAQAATAIRRWSLDLADAGQTLTLRSGDHTHTASIANLPADRWLTLRLVADAGNVTLHTNGRSVTIPATTDDTALTFLGVADPSNDAAGHLHLAHWTLGDTPAPSLTPNTPDTRADDPAAWCVLYRAADPDSADWAQRYAADRRVPLDRLIPLDTPAAETITPTDYASLTQQITDHLALHRLLDDHAQPLVAGLLLAPGTPGLITLADQSTVPVAAALHTLNATPLAAANPQAGTTAPLTVADLAGRLLTARIDAPTPADAEARRAAGLALTLAAAPDAALTVATRDPAQHDADDTAGLALADHPAAASLRLPVDTPASTDPIAGDAILWSTRDGTPAPDAFANTPDDRAGRRAAVVVRRVAQGPTRLRDAASNPWLNAAFNAGHAAVLDTHHAAVHAPDWANALRTGRTLAEATHAATPTLGVGAVLVGDPLATVALPRAGVDVLGPVHHATDLNPNQPLAQQPTHTTTLTREDLDPTQRYAVRRLNDDGSPGPLAVTQPRPHRVAVHWPTTPDWRPRTTADTVTASLHWSRTPTADAPARVELLAFTEGSNDPPAVVHDATPATSPAVCHLPRPTQPTRYAWRLTAIDATPHTTATSAVIHPATPHPTPLRLAP